MKHKDHTLRLLLGLDGLKSARPTVADHMHRSGRIYRYEFVNAETLLADFDKGVIAALEKRGVKT